MQGLGSLPELLNGSDFKQLRSEYQAQATSASVPSVVTPPTSDKDQSLFSGKLLHCRSLGDRCRTSYGRSQQTRQKEVPMRTNHPTNIAHRHALFGKAVQMAHAQKKWSGRANTMFTKTTATATEKS